MLMVENKNNMKSKLETSRWVYFFLILNNIFQETTFG
jgi:hypothetical protein